MGPKYEFTGEQMNYDGFTLHRIKRLSDGKIGGWIESEDNLSQDGNCWVDDNAKVFDEACVYGNAQISDNAKVSGTAKVYGKALVYDNVQVYDDAEIKDNAQVYGNAKVYDNAKVYNNAEVSMNAQVYGNAQVYNNARVFWDAKVYGHAKVYGCATVCGHAEIYDDAEVCGNVVVEHNKSGNIKIGKYYEKASSNEDAVEKVVQDFIYKIDGSNKIMTQIEYDSVDEFFSAQITNNIKLDTLVICTIDTKEPLIKLQKVEKENKLNYRFIVDITIDNGDNFSIKSTIETQEQLNQKLEQTIEALKQYPEFVKYVDDLESCL